MKFWGENCNIIDIIEVKNLILIITVEVWQR